MRIKFPNISLSNVRAVLLDLDDTLYQYTPAHDFALQSCYRDEIASNFTREEFLAAYKNARTYVTNALHPQGACRSRLFAFQKIFSDANVLPAYLYADKFSELYWGSFVTQMTLEEDAISFLKACKMANIKVCIVTDMLARIQIKKLQQLNIVEYIDHLVSSEEAGAEKPDGFIFNLALERMKVNRDEVIMVGDSFDKDVQGARSLGIKVYQVEHV